MAEPALKVATEFIRIAVANFDMDWTPAVETVLTALGLDLTDLHNALTCCEVKMSNQSEAEGLCLVVGGCTTEGDLLEAEVWIDPNTGVYRVERVSPR